MSLGLDDLKKRHRPAKKSAEPKAAPSIQHAWAGKTATTRPWSDHHLTSASGLKRSIGKQMSSDAAMNEDWNSLHASPLVFFTFEQNSRVMELQNRLVQVERKIQSVVLEPLKALRQFWTSKN